MSPAWGRPDASPALDYFDNMGAMAAAGGVAVSSATLAYNTLVVQPLTPFNEVFPGNMTVSTMMLDLSHSALTATASSSAFSSSFMLGVYTMANSTLLSLLNSVSSALTRAAATANTSVFSGGGARWLTFHSSQWSAPPIFTTGRYWCGALVRSSNFNVPGSSIGQYLLNSAQRQGTFGTSNVTATSMAWQPFMGIWSASQTVLPVSIAASGLNKVNASWANFIPHLAFNNVRSAL